MEKIFDITNTITNDPERKITFEPGETFHYISPHLLEGEEK